MAEKFDPDKYLAETEKFDPDSYLAETEEPSKLESALRGAAQGVTFDFADEIAGALGAAGDVATTDSKLSDLKDLYAKYRDIEREKFKKAEEANPAIYKTADIASGIIPALFTGGATAAASVGKVAAKESAKQAAKLGAKYGAATGLGVSEADLTKGEVGKAAKDVAVGSALGAGLGVALPATLKGAAKVGSVAKEGAKKIVEKAKIIPAIKEGIEAFSLSKEGKGVLGEKNFKSIIEESKDIIKNTLKPFLVSEKEKYSSAIGKIIKKVDSLGTEKDISKELDSVQKQVQELIKSGKAPTEESQKVLQELYNLIDVRKKQILTVVPTKKVEVGVDVASKKLNSKMDKLAAINKEVGEEVNFTPPKVDLESGLVSTFETRTGKVISEPIKRGEFTPIKYENAPVHDAYNMTELKSLKDSTYELFNKAKNLDLGVAKKPIARAGEIAQQGIKELAEESGLGKAYSRANESFSDVMKLDEILPKSLLRGGEAEEQMVSQFFRKADIEGISGDDLRDRIIRFSQELRDYNPKFAEQFLSKSEEIAKRYELARTARQSFGLNLGTGKAMAIWAGSGLGSATKGIKTASGKSIKALNKMSDNSLNVVKDKLLNSDNKGLQALGEQLQKAIETEGPLKNALLWSMSQQPALRQLLQQSDEEIMSSFEEDAPEINREINSEEVKIDNINPEMPSIIQETPKSKQTDLNKALELIKRFENNKNFKQGGYDKQTNTWKPHPSLEGGEDTVGYGTKLNKGKFSQELLDKMYKQGLSDEDATRLVDDQVKKSYQELSNVAGEDLSNFMNENQISALLSYWYNAGHIKHPSLFKALKNKDVEGILNNMDVSTINKIPNKSLMERRNEEKKIFNTPVGEIKNNLNRVMKMKSSGMETPEHEIEQVFQGINDMNISDQEKLALQDDVVQMESFSDMEKIKQLLDKYNKMS